MAWRLTGSSAVLSRRARIVRERAAGALLLYSLLHRPQPADRNHPYGHGKVEFFSAGVEGTLIAIAAVGIVYQAVRALIRGPQLRRLDLGRAGRRVATTVNVLIGLYLMRVGRREHSLALVADGRHLLTDVVDERRRDRRPAPRARHGIAFFDPLVALAVAAQILVPAGGSRGRPSAG